MTFKYFLVAILVGFAAYLLLLTRVGGRRKAFILALVGVMLAFALQPEWSNQVAHSVGISRGVDLLFYLSHLMLLFIAFMYFLKFKEMEARLVRLVRQIALENARRS